MNIFTNKGDYVFNKESDNKLQQLLKAESAILKIIYQKPLHLHLTESEVHQYGLNGDQINTLNVIRRDVQNKNVKYIIPSIGVGLLYCILHTRKIIKIKVPFYKSFYAWGFFLFSFFAVILQTQKNFSTIIEKELNSIMIDNIFSDKIKSANDPDLQKRIIEKQIKFFK
jgi:hypothetical protein